MSTKKLVVSTYLQYILIALGALLLFVFVRQLSGVLLTFLFAAVLAYVLNPVVRRLEGWRVPRTIAVTGVFAALIAAVLAALLVFIVPAVGQVQSLVQNPEALTNGAAGLLDRVQELPYVGEQIGAVDQVTLTRLVQSNAPFAVPIVAIIAATLRYLRGTLLFERWRKPPIVEVVPEESPATAEEASVRGCVEGKR